MAAYDSDPHASDRRPDLHLFSPSPSDYPSSSSVSCSPAHTSASPSVSSLASSAAATTTTTTTTSYAPSPSPAPPSAKTAEARRQSARPSPLVLRTNPRAAFSPRTSSLSSNSRISTVTATVGTDARYSSGSTVTAASDDVHQSLCIATTSSSVAYHPVSLPPTQPPPPPAIRRKPLAPGNRSRSSSRSTTATTTSTTTVTLPSIDTDKALPPPPPTSSSITSFDVLYEDVLGASSSDSLATPDTRFTRPDSVDSPTLYEFPGGNEKQTSIQSVLEEHRPTAVAPLSNNESARAPTPVSSQTPTTTSVSQHAHDLTPSPTLDLDLYDVYGTESDTEQPQEPQKPTSSSDRPSSAMSQFSRKTSPPHLQLGSLSNTADRKDHKEYEQHSEQQQNPPSDRDSLYSIYNLDDNNSDDKEDKTASGQKSDDDFVLPVIATSSATSVTTIQTDGTNTPSLLKPTPKSPGGSFKLGSLFGWSASPASTEFSDWGSPLPSPSASLQPPSTPAAHASSAESAYNSNSQTNKSEDLYGNSNNNNNNNNSHDHTTNTNNTRSPLSPSSAAAKAHIEDMEDELQAISAELAASIRREMDLEDLVDRLQTEVGNGPQPGRRTSDYFSDSGYNSASGKAGADGEASSAARDEVAQIQRWAEQEKARVRLELTEKLTDERMRRRELDQQIEALGARAAALEEENARNASAASEADSAETSERVRQLESTCEDLRRRLAEERSVKENFEDLLSAMKTELQSAANERDNLRDEVVPQLRARVEGLESQAAEHARHVYETTKAAQQQELQINKGLPPPPAEQQQQQQQQLQQPQQPQQPPMLSQPPSATPAASGESREALAERLKDVEAQRDALHQALRSLLERQEFQNRENDKRIRGLEQERLRLMAASPKKAGYERDVAVLRDEVAVLRRRAEEALEHKWQVEKGLASLKMDLDRAEAEIAHLHMLLRQNDILVPEQGAATGGGGGGGLTQSRSLSDVSDVTTGSSNDASMITGATSVTSSSLIQAYRTLQASYAEAATRIRQLEASVTPADTDAALQRLEQALAKATLAERDAAAAGGNVEAKLAAAAAADNNGSGERTLAQQVDAAAAVVEALAAQVQAQLAANTQLRDRLAGLAARSGADQQTFKTRITGLEARLRTLEDELVAAQTAAEDRVARHEEQVSALKEANSTQLLRLRDASGQLRAGVEGGAGGSGSPGLKSPGLKSPMSPMFSINGRLVPPATPTRPSSRGSATSVTSSSTAEQQQQQQIQDQAAQMAKLRARVGELEAALATAELEMQEVVGRMNSAQIEAMQLREEREEAARATRRLQRELEAEQVKTFEERFKQLQRA